jgi:choline-phosphate cytidylyltransferase
MAEFRDSIKSNWLTTGQELGKDIKQFWQSSRPASPARTPAQHEGALTPNAASAVSPSAVSRLSHLDIPRVGNQVRDSSDFAAGYSLGLIGGVRSWVS